MINENELRLGNYVDTVGGIQQVEFIAPDGIHLSDGDIRSIEQISPILITPEILQAAGFEKFAPDYWNSTQMHFELGETSGGYINSINCFEYGNGVPIKYLHQLQNLYFSLTGKELEVNIPTLVN